MSRLWRANVRFVCEPRLALASSVLLALAEIGDCQPTRIVEEPRRRDCILGGVARISDRAMIGSRALEIGREPDSQTWSPTGPGSTAEISWSRREGGPLRH